MSAVQAILMASGIDETASRVHDAGEIVGTIAFAASGALLAVRRGLDIVGIVLLAATTALGGGVIRDLLVGNTPPVAFTNFTYLAFAATTSLVIFFWHPPATLQRWPLEITDAVGLGLFVVTGTAVGHAWDVGAPAAALLGLTTGIGGGVIRDVLSGRIPAVLRPDEALYAIPAFAGAVVTTTLMTFDWYRSWIGLLCAGLIIVLRLASVHYDWRGPRPPYVSRAD